MKVVINGSSSVQEMRGSEVVAVPEASMTHKSKEDIMQKFTFNIDNAAAMSATPLFGKLLESGVFSVKVEHAYVAITAGTDNKVLNLQVRTDDGRVAFVNALGLAPVWTSGKTNNSYAQIMAMLLLAGVSTPELVQTTRPYTRDGVKELIPAVEIGNLVGKSLQLGLRYDADEERFHLVAAFDASGLDLHGNSEAIQVTRNALNSMA